VVQNNEAERCMNADQLLTSTSYRKDMIAMAGKQDTQIEPESQDACEYCGKPITQSPNVRGQKKRYCNKQCRDAKRVEKDIRQKTCDWCGKQFIAGKHRAFCSTTCIGFATRAPDSLKNQIRTCIICDKEYTPHTRDQQCCGTECAKVKEAETKTVDEYPWFVCLHCGTLFEHDKSNTAGMYCSRVCQGSYVEPVRTVSMYDIPEAKRLRPRCVICGEIVNAKSKYCSDECRRVHGRNQYYENRDDILKYVRRRHRESQGLELRQVECGICGKEFKTWNLRHKYCSKECADKASYEQCSDSRRDQRRRRRARLRGAIVEKFNSKEIFMRDGWRCQICKRKIRKNAKYPHPHSPTLDHIIPLARGGTHERKNVQLACFICNSKKSADVADGCDQLRMF
jgi:hypothetical protein